MVGTPSKCATLKAPQPCAHRLFHCADSLGDHRHDCRCQRGKCEDRSKRARDNVAPVQDFRRYWTASAWGCAIRGDTPSGSEMDRGGMLGYRWRGAAARMVSKRHLRYLLLIS